MTGRGDAKPRRARYIDSDSDSDSDAPAETSREKAREEEEMVETDEFEGSAEEEERETGGGLAAEELQRERLHAGDTIEYYSMAFVFGDPRGYCVAKVLKVMKRETEYPLRLDTQEMLQSTQMIKRKANRRGEELAAGAAIWRKIRTFKLVDGRVEGKTRANRLNEGLKQAMTGAFQAVRKEVFNKDTPPPSRESKSVKAPKKDGLIHSYFYKTPAPVSASPSKSQRRDRPESVPSKLSGKRRIDLTPPSTGKKLHKSPSNSLSQLSRHRDHESPRRSSKTEILLKQKTPTSKVDLTKFVDAIEETKKNRCVDLNSYLALDKKIDEAVVKYKEAKPTEVHRLGGAVRHVGSTNSSGVSRMRAGGSSESRKPEKKLGRERVLQNFFPVARESRPTAPKPSSDDKPSLNFFLDEGVSASSQREQRDDTDRSVRGIPGPTKVPVKKPLKKSYSSTVQMGEWTSSKKR